MFITKVIKSMLLHKEKLIASSYLIKVASIVIYNIEHNYLT